MDSLMQLTHVVKATHCFLSFQKPLSMLQTLNHNHLLQYTGSNTSPIWTELLLFYKIHVILT